MKEDDMSKVCGRFGLEEEYIKYVDGKTEGNAMLGSRVASE
jgi:hypothetical protein